MQTTDREKLVIPPGTVAIQMDEAITLTADSAGRDLSGLDIRPGDILLVVPVEGRYCRMEDGRLVIEGELRWIMQNLKPKR